MSGVKSLCLTETLRRVNRVAAGMAWSHPASGPNAFDDKGCLVLAALQGQGRFRYGDHLARAESRRGEDE